MQATSGGATMKIPDPPATIPAPTVEDKPFQIGDELTVYEAAMVYAGRHPYPQMFGRYNSKNRREHCLTLLKLGLSERLQRRQRAQRSWDIFCEIGERIKRDQIKPIRIVRDPTGEIDLVDTVISTADLAQLAIKRGEQPKYLRPWADDETRAINSLAGKLKANPDMKRGDALDACRKEFSNLTGRRFQFHIWPQARKAADLKTAASPGRKSKRTRREPPR
jgi:hypothetical protein